MLSTEDYNDELNRLLGEAVDLTASRWRPFLKRRAAILIWPAKPKRAAEQVQRFARRHRTGVIAAALLLPWKRPSIAR